MALDKQFIGAENDGDLTVRTNHANAEQLVVQIDRPRPYRSPLVPAVNMEIKDVAALHAILGNWLKKRDRRSLHDRRSIQPGTLLRGRRSNDSHANRTMPRSGGRRKGDA